jgi:hypothetical protein
MRATYSLFPLDIMTLIQLVEEHMNLLHIMKAGIWS